MSSEITVRYATTLDDVRAICGKNLAIMHREMGIVPANPGKAFKRVHDLVLGEGGDGFALMAERDGVLIGSLGLEIGECWYGDGQVLIDLWFYTLPTERGGLTARVLMREAAAVAGELGLVALITVNNPRRSTARSHGRVATAIRAVAE